MKIGWNSNVSIVDTDYTDSSNLLTQFPKQTATNGTFIELDISGNFIYFGNTDATSVRVVVADNTTSTTVISEDTTLTEDTWYNSLEVTDGYTLTLADGASLYFTDGNIIYDSQVQIVDGNKLLEFGTTLTGTAYVYLESTYLGVIVSGDLNDYGTAEYPFNDEQVDKAYINRTENGSYLYDSDFILSNYSFDAFMSVSEYRSIKQIPRQYVLVKIRDDVVLYGMINRVKGNKSRGEYVTAPIEMRGVV